MARKKNKTAGNGNSAAIVGFEQKLWAAADALRNNMDAAEYKHAELEAQKKHGADSEDRDTLGRVYYTTWRLAKMSLAIRAIDEQIAHGDTFHNDRHPDLKADYVLANPPFNDSDWRGDKDAGEYADVPGFCKRATLEGIRKHGHVLTPGRYVGAEEALDDGEPFEKRMKRLTATLREQQAEAEKLDAAIAANLRDLGFWA